MYINKKQLYKNDVFSADEYFPNIENITVDSIKLYYLVLLRNVKFNEWGKIYKYLSKK